MESDEHQVALLPAGTAMPAVAGERSVSALLCGSGRDAARAIAVAKAELEARLAEDPNDYGSLVLLGEINLRVGLSRQAQALLYRASLQQPPSWEAFQRTSLLLRRAEEQRRHAFDRFPGAPPPLFVRRLAAKAASTIWLTLHKLASARKIGVWS